MLARLRQRLESAIPRATSRVAAGRLRGELAGLLARHGELDRARDEIAKLRAEFRFEPDAGVTAWVSLAEGLLDYYEDLDTGCRDRLQRAYSLASAAQMRPLQALSTAWLALLDYVQHDVDSMAQRLRHAFDLSTPDDHGVRARAGLVAAQGYHWSGHMERAQPWYESARQHALADGDEAMMSAVLYNRYAIQMNLQREAEAQRVVDVGTQPTAETLAKLASDALRGAESTERFDQMVGATSLHVLHPLMRAQLLTIQGQFDEARGLFAQHYEVGLQQGMKSKAALLLADRAWCEVRCGDVGKGLGLAHEAEAGLAALGDADDDAAARCRLVQVYEACGSADDKDRAIELREVAARHWRAHISQQSRWIERLDLALGSGGPPPLVTA
jgi:ATP/maltotriose-dependent transcriptional regulator MalT